VVYLRGERLTDGIRHERALSWLYLARLAVLELKVFLETTYDVENDRDVRDLEEMLDTLDSIGYKLRDGKIGRSEK